MARTNLTKKQLRSPYNARNNDALYTKMAEHDTALDALEGGTTASVVTIHPVRAASTTNIANLAACSTTMDTSVTLVAGNRVLLKDQGTVEQNGIYVVGTVAGGAAPLTRATDWDAAAEIKVNSMVAVAEGTLAATTIWQLTGDFPLTVGVTHQHFVQVVNKTQLAAYLALTTQAGLIGSDAAGYSAATVKGQLAEVKVLADAGMTAQKRTVTINDEDAALTGSSAVIPLITGALPTNAVIFAHEINIIEQFAGLSDVSIKLGGTVDDAIVASTDLDGLAIGKYSGTLGIHPRGGFSGETINATIASAGGNLTSLSAGQAIITVWFFVLP